MAKCKCGRIFNSNTSLVQHQNAKAKIGKSCEDRPGDNRPGDDRPAKQPRSQDTEKTSWLRRDVTGPEPVEVIRSENLECSTVPVTTASFELVGTYNWQEQDSSKASFPGYAPIWQPPRLPFEIQQDDASNRREGRKARLPEYPFEILFRASEIVNPQFSFNDVGIVVNRNSLRKLLDFCGGQVMESFKVNLLMVKDTLFIERCESSVDKLIYGSIHSGWGRNFEKACTRYRDGADKSHGHHRALCYLIGEMRCVVRFEVDACYTGEGDQGVDMTSLATRIGDVCESAAHKGATDLIMPQSTAGELKSAQKPKSPKRYLAQLWFGRTPWLLTGKHTGGRFDSVDVFDASEAFPQWVTANQEKLRKLATLLQQLRSVVKANDGRNFTAICEKANRVKVMEIWTSKLTRRALPTELIRRFWSSEI